MSKLPYEDLRALWQEIIDKLSLVDTKLTWLTKDIDYTYVDTILEDIGSIDTGIDCSNGIYRFSPFFKNVGYSAPLIKNSSVLLTGNKIADEDAAWDYIEATEGVFDKKFTKKIAIRTHCAHFVFMGFTEKKSLTKDEIEIQMKPPLILEDESDKHLYSYDRKTVFDEDYETYLLNCEKLQIEQYRISKLYGRDLYTAKNWHSGYWTITDNVIVQLIPNQKFDILKKVIDIVDEYSNSTFAIYLDAYNQYKNMSKYLSLPRQRADSYDFNDIINYGITNIREKNDIATTETQKYDPNTRRFLNVK